MAKIEVDKISNSSMTSRGSSTSIFSLHAACQSGQIEIVKSFQKKKYNLEERDENGNQPIHYACEMGHIEIVKFLHKNQIDLTVVNKERIQPIHLACKNGHMEIVKYLFKNNCKLEVKDEYGNQPIHYACKNGHFDILKFLNENECDLISKNILGDQAIHLAVRNGHTEILKFLIQNNCDVHIPNENEESAFSLANRKIQEIMRKSVQDSMGKLINQIATRLKLTCKSGCDHIFCSSSLGSTDFKKCEVVGNGAFVNVFKTKDSQSDRVYAIKKIDCIQNKVNSDTKCFEDEINQYYDAIRHSAIIQYYGAIRTPSSLCIYMEYMAGNSLKDLIKQMGALPHVTISKYCAQILEGLAFLHEKNIVHRDIKPANILLDGTKEYSKLCDFGLSRLMIALEAQNPRKKERDNDKNQNIASVCGTPYYMAPEVINRDPSDFRSDIWSLGATITEMLTGNPPYNDMNQYAVIFKIGFGKKIEFVPVEQMSSDLEVFINDMLKPDPQARPTAKDLLKYELIKPKNRLSLLRSVRPVMSLSK